MEIFKECDVRKGLFCDKIRCILIYFLKFEVVFISLLLNFEVLYTKLVIMLQYLLA